MHKKQRPYDGYDMLCHIVQLARKHRRRVVVVCEISKRHYDSQFLGMYPESEIFTCHSTTHSRQRFGTSNLTKTNIGFVGAYAWEVSKPDAPAKIWPRWIRVFDHRSTWFQMVYRGFC